MGKIDLYIIPECYADTNLVEYLIKSVCNHQKGCANVAKKMQEKYQNGFAIGIIDFDKKKVPYVDEFNVVAENDNLSVLRHRSRSHFIIFIKPAIEVFLMDSANQIGCKMSDFGFPDTLEGLKELTKKDTANDSIELRNLYKCLKDSDNLKKLRGVIQYLCEARFGVDDERVREIVG